MRQFWYKLRVWVKTGRWPHISRAMKKAASRADGKLIEALRRRCPECQLAGDKPHRPCFSVDPQCDCPCYISYILSLRSPASDV